MGIPAGPQLSDSLRVFSVSASVRGSVDNNERYAFPRDKASEDPRSLQLRDRNLFPFPSSSLLHHICGVWPRLLCLAALPIVGKKSLCLAESVAEHQAFQRQLVILHQLSPAGANACLRKMRRSLQVRHCRVFCFANLFCLA